MDQVEALLAELLADCDTTSDFGRTRAFRLCLRYAEENLFDQHVCNVFLHEAAQRLEQPPQFIPVVFNRVPLPPEAKAQLMDNDEGGFDLVGNTAALQYFGRLCLELAETLLPGENVLLEEGYAPWVGDSFGLTIFHEDEAWFQAAMDEPYDEEPAEWEAEVSGRIVNPAQVIGVQFLGRPPSRLALSQQRLYRVTSPEAEPPTSAIRKPSGGTGKRYHLFVLTDDDGQALALDLDLDDPDVAFYYAWHLAQFGAEPE